MRLLPFIAALVLTTVVPLGCSGPRPMTAGPPVWVWPSEPRPHRISVSIETLPARVALEYLASSDEDPALLSAAVAAAKESGALRSFETDPEAFREALRGARGKDGKSPLAGVAARARTLLSAVTSLEESKREAGADAALRVARLLPDDPPVEMSYRVVLSLGIGRTAARESLPAESGEGLAFDPARAFTDLEGTSKEALADLAASRIAPALWDRARDRSRLRRPAPPATPTHKEGLALRIFEAGPRRYLELSSAFLPLNRWLKDSVRAAIRELAVESRRNPDDEARAPADRIRDSDLALVGAALVDGIAVTLGPERVRKALDVGPAGLFEAFEEARKRNFDLEAPPEEIGRAAARVSGGEPVR